MKNFTITKYRTVKYEGTSIAVSECHNIENISNTFVAFKKNEVPEEIRNWNVPQLYTKKISLNPKKLKNLLELSENIPLVYQKWYNSLESRDHDDDSVTEPSDSDDD